MILDPPEFLDTILKGISNLFRQNCIALELPPEPKIKAEKFLFGIHFSKLSLKPK